VRIGINALYLLPGKVGGSETYVRNLIKAMAELDGTDEYFIFINRESAGVFSSSPRVRIIPCGIKAENRPLRILWEQFLLPLQVRRHKIDLLLSTGMTAPFCCPARSVLVIFDLQHVNQPGNFSWFHLFFLRSIIYRSAKTADGIITISHHVKKDIEKHYRIDPSRISVGYLGVNHAAFFPSPAAGIEKYRLPARYILYAAALLPHKNHRLLLEAFREVRNRIPDVKLVLTGAWETGQEALAGVIANLGLQNDVIMLGWIPFEDIPAVYRGAAVFVYPTLHEGFGLPILEAMASGVPVVCSKIAPLTEIAEDAAFFIDPNDQSDIAKGVVTMLEDEAVRAKLIEKGLSLARNFTWDKTARMTRDFLDEIAGR
jgi:glycosyltransferase involved in cell wall biosynthesis